MRLTQRQIEIFNAIMMKRSVTAAAVALGTSQPTVTRDLRGLELDIGFELFHRFGKRLTPTNQGLLLHDAVRRSFVGMEEIARAATAIRTHSAANLRIACIPAYAEALLPEVTRQFLARSPAARISLHSLEEASLQHELISAVFDFGLTEGRYVFDGVTTESIAVGEVVCVLPPGHRLTAKMVLDPRDFEDTEFIYFSPDDPYRNKLDEIFTKAGVSRRFAVETTTATSVCAMVSAGVGVSIVNPLTAANYAGRGIVLRKLSVSIPYHVHLWRPIAGPRSVLVDQFSQVLRQTAQEMTEKLQNGFEPG